MGKRITLSESEKLNIKNLYKGLLSEQRVQQPTNTSLIGLSPDKDGGKDGGKQGDKDGGKQGDKDGGKKPNPRKYLPISDEFCDIRTGKAQVKKGAEGKLVLLFQEALIKCGIELPEFGADGNFGNETRDAVREFQRRENLTVDGGIGVETSGKMCELGCIPKEICDKCKGDGQKGDVPVKDGGINVDCEKVQGCISKFMGGLKEDFCIDEDKIKGLLQCVGIGQCFEGGKVPPSDMIQKPSPSDKTVDV